MQAKPYLNVVREELLKSMLCVIHKGINVREESTDAAKTVLKGGPDGIDIGVGSGRIGDIDHKMGLQEGIKSGWEQNIL